VRLRESDLHVRHERPDDADRVHSLIAEAFGDEVVARLKDALVASPAGVDGLSFVAEADGAVVGHVLYTRNLLDAPPRLVDVLVLSPVAVAPAHQGQGIGSELIRRTLESLVDSEFPLVFLEGSPRFYPRFGFVAAGDLGFRKPSLRIPDAAFQVLPLRAHEPWMTGTLVYDQLFWQLDCVGLRDDDA
jgi:putative acetyltransferase